MTTKPDWPLSKALDVIERHTDRNGLCSECCCEFPCDAYLLAEILDDREDEHVG
jgi:hypothetical protein